MEAVSRDWSVSTERDLGINLQNSVLLTVTEGPTELGKGPTSHCLFEGTIDPSIIKVKFN